MSDLDIAIHDDIEDQARDIVKDLNRRIQDLDTRYTVTGFHFEQVHDQEY